MTIESSKNRQTCCPLVPRTNWRHFPNLREGENQFMGRQITWKKALRAETGNNNNSTRQASSPGLEYRPAFGTRWGLSPLRPSVSPIRINVSSLIVLHLELTEISYNASNIICHDFRGSFNAGKNLQHSMRQGNSHRSPFDCNPVSKEDNFRASYGYATYFETQYQVWSHLSLFWRKVLK